jgi:protein-L-isoaspartate(D-aspartate) O-methyltransferase
MKWSGSRSRRAGSATQACSTPCVKCRATHFVPVESRQQAYEEHNIPIGFGQTISQPFIVSLMSQALLPRPGDLALEIGTGCGYQSVVLSEMGAGGFYNGNHPRAVGTGQGTLQRPRIHPHSSLLGDGSPGRPEHAPYHGIMVTAAPIEVPALLSDQLDEGGRMVIPPGPVGSTQERWLVQKTSDSLAGTILCDVRFVPITH